MSIFSAIVNSNKAASFEQALGAKDITTAPMREAVKQWFALYYDGVVDAKEEDGCQRLPVTIVNKLVKTTFAEYEAKVNGGKDDSVKALLHVADSIKKQAMQTCLIGGECFIKPIPTINGFDMLIVRRDCYIPLARRADGTITDVGTAEFSNVGGKQYILLERRTLQDNDDLVITTKLFLSGSGAYLGTPVPLNTLGRYAAIQPELVLRGVGSIGMVQIRTPIANCVDGSADGVAVYAPSMGLIRNINRNERQLNDEFENGASRIIASEDMLTKDEDGKKRLSDKVYVGVDDSSDNVGVTIFSPALREQSYLARKNEYLRNCESLIGLKRGILSNVEAVERTATEVTSSAGDYNLTIIDFQQVWESTLRELVELCGKLGKLYSPGKAMPTADIVVDWGNGVLYDEDKEWGRRMEMVAAGMLKPELALAWKFNLPCDTPEEIAKIRETYMPEMEILTGGGG